LSRREDQFEPLGRAEISSPLSPDAPPFDEAVVEETEALIGAEGEIRSGKLAGKTMWAAIWILALPVLFQQTFQACVGLFDKIIAGSLPEETVLAALDGLGIGSYVGWFIGIAMTGLGIGGQALIARAMGGGDRVEAHRSLGQTMTASAAWGAIVGVGLWFGSPALATLTDLGPEAWVYCVQYVRTLACAMPLCGIMMVGAMCLHGAGETTKPASIAMAVNVVNIVFSWIFSGADIGWGNVALISPFGFDLHVLGIAIGTAVSYLFGAVATLWILVRGVKDLRLEPAYMPIERSMLNRIVRIGIPSFCEGVSMWAVNLFALMFIGIIAERAAANGGSADGLQGAHIIAVQWEAFSFMPGFAIGTAAGALAGQYLGAGNPRQAQRAVLACTGVAVVLMSLLGVIFMTQGEALTRIISDEPIHLEEVPQLLRICGAIQVFFAATMVIRQGLRGVGDTRWTFLITTVSSYGVRLPAAYLLGITFELGLAGIWMGLCGELIIRASLFAARFFHGGWKHIKV
jgi:putative MATE family efflux protein